MKWFKRFSCCLGFLTMALLTSNKESAAKMDPSDDQILYIYDLTDGGIINSKEMASELASIYIARAYGKAYLEAQAPFSVYLKDKNWYVEGHKIFSVQDERIGPFRCVIRAYDGAILRFGASLVFD
jgi:NTF2 fold immunity protein